ncbi:7785_t:CDS:2, partial [Entrophospora sp. SA101]
ISKEQKKDWIDWIYSQQILPNLEKPEINEKICGFRGSPFSGTKYDPNGSRNSKLPFDAANLAMTYTALCSLLTLGDDLACVDKTAIINSLKYLQNDNG